MSVHPLTPSRALDPVREAKVHLAAAHRLAALHDLEEGIDNHFTVTLPGREDRYLVLPFGLHWSEARASDMIVFDESGKTLEGEGTVELSAQCIHAPIHRLCGTRVVLHTHQTWAVALNMLKDNRLLPASQTAAYFHGHVAYDDTYAGTADFVDEGERLARILGKKQVLFMKNHTIPVHEYRSLPIPSLDGTKIGDCFVNVTALPEQLDGFMEVNPRVPNRTQKGVLSGPVVKGILETLTDNPEDMAIKNQGIYLLAEEAEFTRAAGGAGQLRIKMSDPTRHGIVNGGHTYAAIRDRIETADDVVRSSLSRAYVRLHILQGLDEDKVAEIAEGLNRSKQVDDPSLANLQGHFSKIQQVMDGRPGADTIAYHQGAAGDVYITEVLVTLELFNCERFDRKRHPHYLLNRMKSALDFYQKDLDARPSPLDLLLPHLPEILELGDLIREQTPAAAKRVGFEFGRMKVGKTRAGSEKHRNINLPFLDRLMAHHVPNGWLYPMLAAFRANVDWNLNKRKFEWKVPLQELVPQVIDDLVRVCVTEHRDNNLQPDKVGKRESTYVQCYDKVQLYLLETSRS